MNLSPHAIQASYAACRQLSRQAGSNFPAAFLLLPRAKRRAMDALYAFMRHSDDLVDDPRPGLAPEESLLHWRAALEHALLGCFEPPSKWGVKTATAPGSTTDYPDEAAGPRGLYHYEDDVGRAILPAVIDIVEQFRIPPEYLRAALDGVEMDLECRRYQTFGELQAYCERVASAVGLACIHIWGFEGNDALAPARSAGIALQLTNILRDLKEDAEQGRIYLPLDDLNECGYSVDDLRQGVVSPQFLCLMELEVGRAEDFYRQGADLFRWLQPDGQRIFGMMMATYRALLARVKRRPAEVFDRRIRLSWPKKLGIVARWALFSPSAAGQA
jgi:15-cis-phytoene synthase